jgi:hypothetical protein
MRMLFRRLTAPVAVALAPAAIVTIAAPAISSAEQCPDGRTWNPQTVMCDPPPPLPAWYQAAPSYAQSWAPAWAPPPPPAPPWADALGLKMVWDPRLETWNLIYVR